MEISNHGILIINKQSGMTSRHVGNIVGKKFGIKKIGHLGTLDPLATGVLIIALGEGTKVLPFIEEETKTYVATFKLGLLTSTLDNEGNVLEDNKIDALDKAKLKEVLASFVGEITQIPPLTSAIKVDGVKMYEYAHNGIDFEVPSRTVKVYSLRLKEYIHPFFTLEAVVGKGTYIRTLGDDIAAKFNTRATTVRLERTSVGRYSLDQAVLVDEVVAKDIIPLAKVVDFMPTVTLDDFLTREIRNGKDIQLKSEAPHIQVHDENGKILAICEKKGNLYHPIRGFNL